MPTDQMLAVLPGQVLPQMWPSPGGSAGGPSEAMGAPIMSPDSIHTLLVLSPGLVPVGPCPEPLAGGLPTAVDATIQQPGTRQTSRAPSAPSSSSLLSGLASVGLCPGPPAGGESVAVGAPIPPSGTSRTAPSTPVPLSQLSGLVPAPPLPGPEEYPGQAAESPKLPHLCPALRTGPGGWRRPRLPTHPEEPIRLT